MINNGTNYADAYFAINYVKAFSTAQPLDPVVSGTQTLLTSATGSATATGASPSGSGSTTGSSGAVRVSTGVGSAVGLGAVVAAAVWAIM